MVDLYDPSYVASETDILGNPLIELKDDMNIKRLKKKGNIYNQLIPDLNINRL